MDNEGVKRVSQAGNAEENSVPDLLEAASAFARGLLETMQQVAGTSHCKGVQIAKLAEWAKENDCWMHYQTTSFMDMTDVCIS